jgi:ubiquinone/menaquinone biosynthesis C-methylase UbiE
MSKLQYDEAAARQLEEIYLSADVVAQRARTMALLGLKPGERVLDIGSGPGFLCTDMAAAVGPQGKVRGIDISPMMVARAAARNPEGWVSFATGDATKLDEADASYDVVVSVQVAEYVPDIDAFCREAFRVLKPGGRALIMATDWDAIAWYSRDPARMQRVLAAFAPHCADSALPRTLARHLRGAGFALGAVTPHPILNHGWKDDSYGCRVIPFITAYVSRQKGVAAEELAAWGEEQRALGASGEFYFLTCRMFFAARKPG